MEIIESLALGVLFSVMIGVIIFGVTITVERIQSKGKDEITYHPPSKSDSINNNLKMINETLDSMQKQQRQNELENSIKEGYQVQLKVESGQNGFGQAFYDKVIHYVEADNFENDGEWITLYKDEVKVATHPTEQVQFITKTRSDVD